MLMTVDGTHDALICIDGVEKYTFTDADAGDLPVNETTMRRRRRRRKSSSSSSSSRSRTRSSRTRRSRGARGFIGGCGFLGR